ncbi:IS4 family transposase [Nostoc sp. FACHB-892]|uniref:IS4 family transposase n=1 Tax=Nostoc sp. FACHB-892 TaxID=2692843 RepID=UPI00168616CA|nr:IS4 family transposase [Nostoc sp. FACHB-892]MBD2730684.1 IS4 family transposase [Nostoc sp. FACHB-892]
MTTTVPNRVQVLKTKFTTSLGLPFRDILPEWEIQQVIDELGIKYRRRLFDPFVTLWVFLSQVLDVDKSCENAVSRVSAWLASEACEIPSIDTGAYCKARKRLPEQLLEKLFNSVAEKLQGKVMPLQLWCGRHIKVIDGSTVSMPDSIENQKSYPQPSSQQPGCGFSIAKIGVIFCLTTGAAIALAVDVLNTHDIKLARKLAQFLHKGDVLLGDRAFCAYADLVVIKNMECDAVFRKHQSRKTSMRRGKIVGACDKLVTWHKPKKCPQGLSQSEFAALPKTLIVREIYYHIVIPGFRTTNVSLITTLLDSQTYTTLEIVGLYDSRWDVEVNLKHLKTTLGMEVLRGKTPEIVRKEIYAFLLAYNLLRTLMWEAGMTFGVPPLRLSLQGTRHHLDHFIPELLANTGKKRDRIYRTLLLIIVYKPVPDRPGRAEPRVRKRRPKAYPLMKQPRNQLRRQLQTA